MTREEAKKAAEVMMAYADGKEIEFRNLDSNSPTWDKTEEPYFSWSSSTYRVKPKTEFRPFKNQEECWEEIKKHQPFGWLINKKTRCYVYPVLYTSITAIFADKDSANFNTMFKGYTFADGTPFGIKEE